VKTGASSRSNIRDCRTRTWAIDSGPKFSQESIEAASRAIAPDPPNLSLAGLAHDERKHRNIDLEDLDDMLSRAEQ
jgi:hypothetical protein